MMKQHLSNGTAKGGGLHIDINELTQMLSQHIGKAAEPTVKVGDSVKVGDVIAAADENALGVNIHSSITGVITDVNDKFIVVASEKGVN